MGKINKYGIIQGGICDCEHRGRRVRERGAGYLRAVLTRRGYLRKHGKRWRVLKIPGWNSKQWIALKKRSAYVRANETYFRLYKIGAHFEIGMRRAYGVFEYMKDKGISLTPAGLTRRLNEECAYQSDLRFALFGRRRIRYDAIYRQRRKDGDIP